MPLRSRLSAVFQFRFALKNLRRHPRRTLLTGSVVALCAAVLCFMFSYFNGILDGFLATYARLQSGHLRLVNAGYPAKESLLPLDLSVSDADSIRDYIAAHEGIHAVTERIRFGALASSGENSVPVIGMGLDFEREEEFLEPKAALRGGRIPSSANEALIGHLLGQRLGLGIGDTLLLLGQDSHRSLTIDEYLIAGLMSLGMNPVDRRSVYLRLDGAREFCDLPGASTEILVLLRNPEDVQPIKNRLARELGAIDRGIVILGWQEQGDLFRTLASSKAAIKIFILYFLLIAASTIVNTILMAVLERGREIGMLKALGMSQSAVAGLFILEGMLIGVLFAPVGATLGAAVAFYTENVGIPLGRMGESLSIPFGNVIYPDLRWDYFLQAIFFTLLMSAISSVYPAWKAGRVKITAVLRTHN